MKGEQRRQKITQMLRSENVPLSGSALAKSFAVSRQVIVQDIALLRANGMDILSTNRGYILRGDSGVCRVFKVRHEDEEVEQEMNLIVDLGGRIEDVFVYHKVYGVIKADLNIRSRMDVKDYVEQIRSGKSSLLKNVTSGYHYHTIYAASEENLDKIQRELETCGFLAKLQAYEPVDFWSREDGQNEK